MEIPQRQIALLIQIGVAIFALRAAGSLIALWLRAAQVRVLKRATLRLREDLLHRLFMLSRAAYTRLDRDTTHARIVLDTERLDEMSHTVVARLLPAVFSGAVLLVLLAFLNARLLLLTLALAPLLLFTIRATGRLVKRRVFVFQRAFETFSNGILFVLQHMDLTLVQSFEAREEPAIAVAIVGAPDLLMHVLPQDAAAYETPPGFPVRGAPPAPAALARHWAALLTDTLTIGTTSGRPRATADISPAAIAAFNQLRTLLPWQYGSGVASARVAAAPAALRRQLREAAFRVP